MEAEIISMLRTFGWTEGLHIPIANEENRILESKVEEALKKRKEVLSLLYDSKNNLISVQHYYDNIIEQRSQNEHMLVDYRKQLEVEKGCLSNINFEKEMVIRDTREIKKKTAHVIDDNKNLQIQIDQVSLKCARLQKDISWSEEIDNCLTESINTGNSDINLLQEYNLQDNVKFQQLEVKRLQLVAELDEYKTLLNNKISEITNTEYEFEKLSKLLESLFTERQWLVNQWETSVKILRRRDKEIEDLIQEMRILTEVTRKVESDMLEYEGFFKEQLRNNMEIDIQTRYILRDTCNQQQINDKLTQELDTKMNELTDRRNELFGLGSSVSDQRIHNTVIKREINTKTKLIEMLKSDEEKLTEKLRNLKSRSVSITDRMQQLEQILQNEQKRMTSALQNRQKMDRILQELKCKMVDVEMKYSLVSSEIKQLSAQELKLNKTIEQINAEIKNETDQLTAVEQQISKIRAKIRYLKEEKSHELKVELENELSVLTSQLNEKNKLLETICKEVDKCNAELKILNKEIKLNLETADSLKDQKEKLILQVEAEEKHFTKMIDENKEKELTETMLNLRISQLEKALNKTEDSVFSLEKQKIELETLLRERLLEIEASANLLKIRKKTLQDEISNLKRNVDQINARTNQFMKRYEIILNSVRKDEDGEPITLSNYKIKLVKERYTLLEKGDDLDEKIRKAEKEIQAMENTLLLMNVSNNSYKKSLSSVDQNSEEYREKEKLEEEHNKLLNVLRKSKQAIPQLHSEIEMLQNNVSELHNLEGNVQRMSKEKEYEFSQLQRDVNEQCLKLQRVQTRLKSLKKNVKTQDNVHLLEREFLSKELQNINKTVLSCIVELIFNHPEVESNVSRYLSEKGISLPKLPALTRKNPVFSSARSSSRSQQSETDNNSSISTSVKSAVGSKSVINLNPNMLAGTCISYQ